MSKRIIVLPEELQIVVDGMKQVEECLKKQQYKIEDPILNTEKVMELLSVSRRTLQNWRDEGLIEFSAVNGKFFYRMSAINKMLDKHLIKVNKEDK